MSLNPGAAVATAQRSLIRRDAVVMSPDRHLASLHRDRQRRPAAGGRGAHGETRATQQPMDRLDQRAHGHGPALSG